MKMLDFLNSENKWTKFVLARDQDGKKIEYKDSGAVAFCLVAAYCRCYPNDFSKYQILKQTIQKNYPRFGDISDFNDDEKTTFEDVRKVLELADV